MKAVKFGSPIVNVRTQKARKFHGIFVRNYGVTPQNECNLELKRGSFAKSGVGRNLNPRPPPRYVYVVLH